MSNKQQTAIEWLLDCMPTEMLNDNYIQAIFKQAKELEKQQMIDFGFDTYCFISGIMKVPFEQLSENKLNAEHNYKQTYGE